MSQRRTRKQRSDLGRIQYMVSTRTTPKEDVQEGILTKKPTTINDQKNLISVLRMKEANKTTAAATATRMVDRDRQERVLSKPYAQAQHSNIQSTKRRAARPNMRMITPSTPKGMRENSSKKFRQTTNLQRQDKPPQSSSRQPRKYFGGVPSTDERAHEYRRSRQQFKPAHGI